jgi:hypothetical protein
LARNAVATASPTHFFLAGAFAGAAGALAGAFAAVAVLAGAFAGAAVLAGAALAGAAAAFAGAFAGAAALAAGFSAAFAAGFAAGAFAAVAVFAAGLGLSAVRVRAAAVPVLDSFAVTGFRSFEPFAAGDAALGDVFSVFAMLSPVRIVGGKATANEATLDRFEWREPAIGLSISHPHQLLLQEFVDNCLIGGNIGRLSRMGPL